MIYATDFHSRDQGGLKRAVMKVTQNSAPTLIGIEEAEVTQPTRIKQFLKLVAESSPQHRTLVISALHSDYGIPAISLGPLSERDIARILESRNLFGGNEFLAGGNPRAAIALGELALSSGLTPSELSLRLREFQRNATVDDRQIPISTSSPEYATISSDLVIANDDILRRIRSDPSLVHQLSPRGFEEFVAEIMTRQGYEVSLTPFSKDGGKDIYVAQKSGLGTALYVVECKKYSPERPVGVGIVRQLYGVVQAERLTGGIVATTSFFTRGAREFQEEVRYQLSLRDYLHLQNWLDEILGKDR